jgi:excisionase family DNA binding protein
MRRNAPSRPNARLLDTAQAAELLRLSPRQVQRLIATGELFSVKSGSRRRIPDSAIDDYIANLIQEAQ